MILDGYLSFTNSAANGGDLPTTGTQTATNILDLGIGANATTGGLPLSGSGGGARDIGIGDSPALKLLVQVITLFSGGTNLYVTLSGAPDSGTGTQGSYTTMYTGPTVTEANLIVGARLADVDVPRPAPGQALPRYLRLQYVTSGAHTAGAVFGAIVLDRHDLPEQANATLGGYPAGVVVAN